MISDLVKSEKDGRWYYRTTKWKYVLDSLCDCIGYFSEEDMYTSELFKRLDSLAEDVSSFISSSKCQS